MCGAAEGSSVGRMHVRAHLHVCASGLNSQGVSREASVVLSVRKINKKSVRLDTSWLSPSHDTSAIACCF